MGFRSSQTIPLGTALGLDGEGVELPMTLDEAGLSSEALDHPSAKEGKELFEVVVGRGAGVRRWGWALGSGLPRRMGHPIEVDLPS